MNDKLHTGAVDTFFDAVLALKDREECYRFFEDIATVNEVLSLSQRLEVAGMLKEGRTYLDIAHRTGASTATISRVGRSMSGGNGSYDIVFERLNKKKEDK
ncbi:MAG: TrpR YerC/YecD [Lachnospiraceae bacterium]|nr:TrpR YerC/YecD [Lachnospiraceae bacterium]MBR1913374.1 TrpR YerC/YecD [Lachnospiraceae bacterium]